MSESSTTEWPNRPAPRDPSAPGSPSPRQDSAPPKLALRPPPGPKPPWRRPGGRPAVAALICLLIIVGGGLALLTRLSGGVSPASAQTDALAGIRFDTAGALGRAQVLDGSSGPELLLRTSGLLTPAGGGRFSVWLEDSGGDTHRLGSLRIGGAPARFVLPSDAARYRSLHVVFQSGPGTHAASVLALSGPNPARSRAGGSPGTVLTVPDPTWADEFSGTSLNSRHWKLITGGGGHGNHDLEDYGAPNVAVGGGHLTLTARHVGHTFTSGAIDSFGHVSARYGLIEAEIQVPTGTGLWPTFWLEGTDLPSVGWPASGEIDAMEILHNDDSFNNGSIHTASQTGNTPVEQVNKTPCGCDLTSGFHVYGIDWSPNRIQFMLDGHVYATTTRAAVEARGGRWTFDKPFFVLLSLAVGGTGDGNPTAATPFPATMSVDWVRVYANS